MPDSHPLVCRFGAFGDMVLITPLLRQLYQRSGLPCDVVAIGAWNRLLFQRMPWVRDVLTIDSRAAPYWFSRSQRELVRELKSRGHRFAWVCETDARSYRLLARAGIGRAGSISQLDLEPVGTEHYCEKWLRLGSLSPPGFDRPQAPVEAVDTELFVGEDEVQECRRWLGRFGLDAERPVVCIQAGSKRTTRRGRADRASNTKYWPENNWAEVVDALVERLDGVQVLLCGVESELPMCQAIEARCARRDGLRSVAGDLPLRRLLALLSISHSCISVDTGPAHAAAALDCPLTVLFGKANPARFRPRSASSPVSVLQGLDDDGQPDIARITPQQVIQAWSADL